MSSTFKQHAIATAQQGCGIEFTAVATYAMPTPEQPYVVPATYLHCGEMDPATQQRQYCHRCNVGIYAARQLPEPIAAKPRRVRRPRNAK